MNIKAVTALFFLLVVGSPAFAEVKAEAATSIQNQIGFLENKVTVLESVNSKILNTVYWTLGAFLTVFLGVIALNFFQTAFAHKKEFASLREDLYSKQKIFVKDTEGAFAALREDILDVQRESYYAKTQKHKDKVPENYIRGMIEILGMDIRKNWDWMIQNTLDEILQHVKKGPVSTETLSALPPVLARLPEQYKKVKDEIEKNMRS